MKLKDVFKAQSSLTKYIEDSLIDPLTSEQCHNAMIVLNAMAASTQDDVVKQCIHCVINTLWSIKEDRKPVL